MPEVLIQRKKKCHKGSIDAIATGLDIREATGNGVDYSEMEGPCSVTRPHVL